MNKLLNIKDSTIIKLIDYIKDSIKGTLFEGHVYIVGGAVRDWIMGKPCKDIDIVVDIRDGGIGFANFIAFKNGCLISKKNPVVFPTYGTAKFQLLSNEEFAEFEIECVQTRKEQYHKDSRNPSTAFGSIEEDAMRRDLTINALYYNVTTDEIKDYTGRGRYDIAHHIIRTPSSPDIIFNDDPLRILRVIRFATRFGWGIEKKTWLGMVKNSKRILIVSQERITDEINKILLTDKPSLGIKRMLCCNRLLEYVLPGVLFQKHVFQNMYPKVSVFEHSMEVLDCIEPKLEYRLAALFHDIGKLVTYDKDFMFHATAGAPLTEKLMKAMKYPNTTISNVSVAVALHETLSGYRDKEMPSKKFLRKFKSITGKNYDLIMSLIDANNKCQYYGKKPNQVTMIREKIAQLEVKEHKNLSVVKLPINGNDIMKNFDVKSGPLIGKLLKTVKEAYFDNPKITKEECLDLVSDTIKKTV